MDVRSYWFCLTGLFFFAGAIALPAEEPSAEAVQFFEAKIRPLLAESCQECHGATKQQGDVRLDRRDAVFPHLITPGQPAQSRLIQVVNYAADDTQMPPKGKLSQDKIDLLTQWVQQGAPWPKDATAASSGPASFVRRPDGEIDFDATARSHWAYQSISRPVPPVVSEMATVATPVDRFVQARLATQNLKPAVVADRATLIRRLYSDLLGVRPTYEDVEAFVHDSSPTASADLVDTLLASPRFGERWGRHWLDIARYGDTKGYVFTEERRYPFSYTYRDYVIAAFNSDKPYDRFLIEQLAADKLGLPEGDPNLAAMGFLTVGPRFLNDVNNIIDDRLDVITRGVMGMTLTCARCHDHKYDPIPAADYYSLYGVMASTHEPGELPQIGELDSQDPESVNFREEFNKRQSEVDKYLDQVYAELTTGARNRVGDYLIAAAKRTGQLPPEVDPKFDPPLRDKQIDQWEQYLKRSVKIDSPVWFALASLGELPQEGFAEVAKTRIQGWAEGACHPLLWQRLKDTPPTTKLDLVKLYGQILTEVRERWEREKAAHPDLAALPEPDQEQLRQVLYGEGTPGAFPRDQLERVYGRDHREHVRDLRKKVAEWVVTSPGSPPHAMTLADNDQPHEPVIFERGNPGRRGPQVPRRMPRILGGNDSPRFTNGSGRLELAQAIASPQNPLTARVYANRVWAMLLGSGLVPSQGDFGVRTEPPSHPELLDWLAGRLIDSGWSTKALIREIVLSHTYQQAIVDNATAREVDPENRLVWRQNRRRLAFEPMRDSMLAVAGSLDDRIGGRPVEIEKQPFTHRRSVYTYIDRNNFSGLLRTFDFPSPDASQPLRPQTTVPQQALFAMNAPFVQELSQQAATHAHRETPDATVTALFRQILARDPDATEAGWATSYLLKHDKSAWEIAQVLLLSNEFLFAE